jgi:photosystem II stability/assembly factor-like uncharacterized protein
MIQSQQPHELSSTRIAILAWIAAVGIAVFAAAQAEPPPEPELAIKAPLAQRSLLLDAASIEGRLVAVGERGHILLSDDGGASWSQADVPTTATLTGVFFHDGELGWAVGHDAVILRTGDGGETWQLLHHAPEEERPFLDVWFKNAEEGFAIGAYGFFYATTDGGDSWTSRVISDFDAHLHHLSRSESGRLYIAAEMGMVYRSDDGGESWIELPSPYRGSFFATLPLDGDAVLLAGLRGHLFRSDDAGESWQEIETGTVAMLSDGLVLTDGRPLIAGLEGAILVSEDGGRSFGFHPMADRRGISSVVPAGEDALLLVGNLGVKTVSVSELTAAGER